MPRCPTCQNEYADAWGLRCAQCGPTGACRNKVCVTTWCQ